MDKERAQRDQEGKTSGHERSDQQLPELLPSLASFLLQPLFLLAFELPGGRDLGQGVVAEPDVTARSAPLDAELILAQQADRLGGLEHVRERGRAVPLGPQGREPHQPGRQRAVRLAIAKLNE